MCPPRLLLAIALLAGCCQQEACDFRGLDEFGCRNSNPPCDPGLTCIDGTCEYCSDVGMVWNGDQCVPAPDAAPSDSGPTDASELDAEPD